MGTRQDCFPPRFGDGMDSLSLLIKPASAGCNLRCRYCFYADVASARDVPNRGMMSLATLETLVKRAFEEAGQFVSFGFQGGEPMLAGLDFYRAFCDFQERYNTRGIEFSNSIQTNGSLVDQAWAAFFAERHFLVGLSVDGDKSVHDTFRLDAHGDGTHGRCMAAAKALKDAGAEFNLLSVVTRQFARHPDKAWQFYKKNDFRYVQLIPCMDGLDESHGDNPYSLDAELYGRFLCRFFDLWYEDFIKGDYISVRAFDNWVRMLMGQPPENCGMAGQCSAYPVIEADGSVYPCDFYVLDANQIGDVQTDSFAGMLQSEAAKRFMAPSLQPHADCQHCEYGFICRGGCRRDREPVQAGATSLNCYCEGYKLFFAHALPRMADIARKMPR